jgi:EAL domain-containing protein (putative c-di-GMP-specific phosphodiesterase class I)
MAEPRTAATHGFPLPRVDAAGAPTRRSVPSEASLREALEQDQLVLHYQPIVDLVNGSVVGVEALVRWQHPVAGLLGPDLFIPLAEAGDLMVPLGEWVLREACTQAARWREDGLDLHMAVNLSPRQIGHPDVVATIVQIVRETGLDPHALVLEVTESAVMEDAEVALSALVQLSALGISLAIDDFGTGYSSLLYLKRYPINILKVDRSFVSGIGVHDEDEAIVASLIGLARAVGAGCVAEGVETVEQCNALRALGSGFGQGWLFGRAVDPALLPGLVVQCEADMAVRLQGAPVVGDRREQAGDARDELAHQRDVTADDRDVLADARDRAGGRRDEVGHLRDRAGDRRDLAGDLRDAVADQRDARASERDAAAEVRDEAAASRDRTAEATGVDSTGSAAARADAAADRARASQDRTDGATERLQAEHDRDVAQADRGAGATERSLAEQDRETAELDRGIGAEGRSQAENDRDSAQLDRGISASRRAEDNEHLGVLGVAAIRDRRQRRRG